MERKEFSPGLLGFLATLPALRKLVVLPWDKKREKNLIDIIGDLFIYNHESAENRQKSQHGVLIHKAECSFKNM